MEVNKTKKYHIDLYSEYKELKKKTTPQIQHIEPNQEIKYQDISAKDVEKRMEIEKKLIEGLTSLSDDQLIELAGDFVFTVKAQNVLRNRRMVE